MTNGSPPDAFDAIPAGSVDEIIRQGEAKLRAMAQFAIAFDQRATTMAGILTAGAMAILALSTRVAGVAGPQFETPIVFYSLIAASIGFLIAAGFCIWATWPTDYFVDG